jgi:hypothetical protein
MEDAEWKVPWMKIHRSQGKVGLIDGNPNQGTVRNECHHFEMAGTTCTRTDRAAWFPVIIGIGAWGTSVVGIGFLIHRGVHR